MRPRTLLRALLAAVTLTLGLAATPAAHAADNAAFASQSVPTSLNVGQVATVSVTMQNNGTTTWAPSGDLGFKLGTQNPQDNTLWTGTTRVYMNPGDSVPPGGSKTFTFNITAPGTPGTYNFQWRMVHEGVAWFGALSTNVAITVVAAPADAAAFVSQSVPSSMTTGQTSTVSVTMQNTGTATWTESGLYRLGSSNPQDNFTWGTNRVLLNNGDAIAPGQTKTFTFNVTAPAAAGNYNFQWRMVHDNVAWFGAVSTNVVISVTAPPAYSSQFVSQSVPSTLNPGQVAAVSVTMQNTGGNVWTAAGGYKLGAQNPQDNVTWGLNRVTLAPGDSIGFNGQKTFSFNITAPGTPGSYNFQWRMLQEGVAWFGAFSPNVVIQVTAQAVTLCPGVVVVPDGTTDLSSQLQTCIDNTASGGTLEIPPGAYGLGSRILINRPMTVRTQGLGGSSANCEAGGISCAVLKALPSFNAAILGFVAVENTSDVTLDHLIIDGNRAARQGTQAQQGCAGGTNTWGFNAHVSNCSFCRFTNSVSRNALCGTSLGWDGNDATITNNVFRGNGQNSVQNMWSDGLTIGHSDRGTVTNNTLVDNSDVALIVGGGRNALVANNSISQPGQLAFAGLMLDNFNGTSSGDFAGAIVTGNAIDCSAARNCHFGIELGPHPWYLSTNIVGGDVHGNTVSSARQGINVEGGGTAAAPLVLYGNSVSNPAPSPGSFLGCTHATSAINISPDSVVNRNGDTTPITQNVWHGCV
jgi:plastocyanin